LLAHAFFKALLFLGAGSVIHAAHHEQDIRRLGGLRTPMRVTFATFAVGTMALAGVPFLFSGFWSKEAILHAAHGWEVSMAPFIIALIAVVLTAFYNTRLMAEVFFGRPRSGAASHAHENSAVMTVPLVVLAVCAVLVGFIGTPLFPWLQARLNGETEVHGHSLFDGASLMVTSIVLVALGVGIGWALYGRRLRSTPTETDPLAARFPGLFGALANRLGFDEFYVATFGRLNSALAATADWLDRKVWDGAVRLAARLGELTGLANRRADEGVLNGSFDAASRGLRGSGDAYSRAQTGDPRSYLRVIAIGFVVLVLLVAIGGSQ
jgi:NADH-quinone oxidoreductase subunit L